VLLQPASRAALLLRALLPASLLRLADRHVNLARSTVLRPLFCSRLAAGRLHRAGRAWAGCLQLPAPGGAGCTGGGM
jgi:hypothetical protein